VGTNVSLVQPGEVMGFVAPSWSLQHR